MNRFISFLAGALTGALVGATVAILLAPASGKELQGQLRGEIERIQIEVKQAAVDKRTAMEQQLATLRKPRKPGESPEA